MSAASASTASTDHATASVIAIDGPAGAGKSTIAQQLAETLGFFLLDTGAIYRAVAYTAIQHGTALDDGARLAEAAAHLAIEFTPDRRVLVAGVDVSTEIRSPEVSLAASQVSAHPPVREALLEVQRRLARAGRCVVEGRDIGTVVLPWAPVKFFMTASAEVRAERRYQELTARGVDVDLASTLAEIIERDRRDETRAVAPLKAATDAILIDTSALELPAVLAKMVAIAKQKLPAL